MNIPVCIILVNYNNARDTVECINSIFLSTYRFYQIIVVDNSPTSDSAELLKAQHFNFPEAREGFSDKLTHYSEQQFEGVAAAKERLVLVRANNNGFAAANNIALRYFLRSFDRGYAWLLNNDTVIERDSLAALIHCTADQTGKIGITGSKLFTYFERTRLQGVGGKYNKWFGKVKEIGYLEKDTGQWDSGDFNFDYVIGASMFVSRPFLEDVGLMNENYFLYFEELDWALRGKQHGWKLNFCAKSTVYHKMGQSINKSEQKGNTFLADFYSVRNRILFTKKFFPFCLITLYPSFLLFIWNRIWLKQPDRIALLFRIMLHPHRKHNG